MWICLNDGFLSVVADKNDSTRLMVRSRRKGDLTNIFGPDVEIIETPDSDYRWRTFIDRAALKLLVNARIDVIDYANFKNSVEDHDLNDLYTEMWSLHRRFGRKDPAIRPKRTRKSDRRGHFAWGPGDLEHHPPKD